MKENKSLALMLSEGKTWVIIKKSLKKNQMWKNIFEKRERKVVNGCAFFGITISEDCLDDICLDELRDKCEAVVVALPLSSNDDEDATQLFHCISSEWKGMMDCDQWSYSKVK